MLTKLLFLLQVILFPVKWVLQTWKRAVISFVSTWLTLHSFIGLPIPKDFVPWPAFLGASVVSTVPSSSVRRCNVFNSEHWQTGQGLLVQEGDLWRVATSAPNGLFRYENAVPLNSNIRIDFVPQSDSQMNFVVTMHDLYEMTIGDGSYHNVTVKTARGDGQEMEITSTVDGKRSVVFSDGDIKKGTEVNLVLQQAISRIENNNYELNLRLSKRSPDSTATSQVLATYVFPLPPTLKYESDNARFSVGLKAATDETRVAAKILCVDFDS